MHVHALERGSKTPVHLDLASSEWLAETDRLTGLGATVRERFERHAVRGVDAGSAPPTGVLVTVMARGGWQS